MDQKIIPEDISDDVFERLATFVKCYCGIQITPQKRLLVVTRLQRRLRALGMRDVDAYCALLLGGDHNEGVAFINEITTNKTDFFREKVHFDFLAEKILPQLARDGRRNVKIWSAASSTGAGAYSCAMVLENFRRRQHIDYSVLATDICTDVLQTGHNGCYPMSMMEPIPEELRRLYVMLPRDPGGKEFRIVPQLRQKVEFLRINLMDETYPVAKGFDVIFCRNILIYFDHATQMQVIKRLIGHLRPGGYLITGHSEIVRGAGLPLQAVFGGTIHQRVDHEAALSGRFAIAPDRIAS